MHIKIPALILSLLVISLLAIVSCTSKPEPTVSPLSPIATATQQAAMPSVTTLPSDWVTDTPNPAVSPIIISDVTRDANGLETIAITNISDAEQSLANMTVLNPATLEYVDLPSDVTLPPGASFKVYNGPGATEASDGLAWLDEPALWLIGDHLVLLNQAGRVLWNYVNSRNYP